MASLLSGGRGLRPMVLAIVVTFCAAGLVLYFQHQTLSALDAQTRVVLRQLSEQTATDIALEVNRAIDGPVFDTLTAVNHPELRAGRLDLVAREFDEGLRTYPHVNRFFVWTSETEAVAPGEALFYGNDLRERVTLNQGAESVQFGRDAVLGREILQIARRYAPDQHIYAASDSVGAERRQALLRLFWTDAQRVEFFAILGYVVEASSGGQRLFEALHQRAVGELLRRRGGEVPLRLRVIDESGALVFGQPTPLTEAALVPLAMRFYPVARIDSRLASTVPTRPWQIEVSAARSSSIAAVSHGYWPTVLSVVLMLVALGLTVVANRRAADLTRMQADFISHVSHQLKTPLSLLSAATETVSMDRARSPEKLAQYLGIIRAEVARLSVLVQRILEYSRLQQQRGYEFEPVDLAALVRETVSAFESSLSSRDFSFVVEIGGPSPMVSADPAAIEQALVNLLDNAVKYAGTSRQVIVRLRSLPGSAVIEVVDHGIGIDDADRHRIFEKFYRGRGGSIQREGFGLGLPIVQELVHAHRGRIEVESLLGRGSTFRITLPTVATAGIEAQGQGGEATTRRAVT
jgi:signal transduction histidine kinase